VEADLADREDRMVEHDVAVVRREAGRDEVVAGDDAQDARACGSGFAIDAPDARVRPRRTDDDDVRHPRHRKIDREAGRAGHLRDAVGSQRRRPGDPMVRGHPTAPVGSAASSTASTMVP